MTKKYFAFCKKCKSKQEMVVSQRNNETGEVKLVCLCCKEEISKWKDENHLVEIQ